MQVGQNQQTHTLTKVVSSKPPAKEQGALIIIDSFHASTDHGTMVEKTALDIGSTGKVHRYNQLETLNGELTSPVHQAVLNLAGLMATSMLPPDQATKHFEQFLNDAVSGKLDSTTSLLERVTQHGFEDSVVNLSQGMDAIEYFKSAKQPLGSTRLTDAEKQTYFYNLNSAVAPDPSSRPTVAEFDNLLLQKIKTTLRDSPRIQESKSRWRDQVRAFEANHNSVVIAAGNSGQIMSAMSEGGFETDGSEDENILATPEATMVAATATTQEGKTYLASPSSFGPEVDFIASGFHGQNFGSSFASPRVAAAMLALHVSNPGTESDEVEKATGEVLGQPVEIRNHQVFILNETRTSRALQQIAEDKTSAE
jgi:Subtilase family